MLTTIICIIALIIFGYLEYCTTKKCEINCLTLILATLAATGVLICVLLCAFTPYNGDYSSQEAMENEYVILTAKIDNGYYNDNALLTYDLVNDVREYNNNVISMQRTINSPWTSWFGRSWMRDLKTIDFPKA